MRLFISRPNYPGPSYQNGLSKFLRYLKSIDIEGVTLGITSGANLSPVKEVIKLVDSCAGVVVVGLPQIRLKDGLLKGVKITNLVLPTEWNHIEAAIGLARGKSLFVIRDRSVSVRGTLDDGAVGQYVQVVEGKTINWSTDKTFRAAFKAWTDQITLRTFDSISYLEISILLRLRDGGNAEHNFLKLFFQNTSTVDLKFALEVLTGQKYIKTESSGKTIAKNLYKLTSKGCDVLEGYSVLGVH